MLSQGRCFAGLWPALSLNRSALLWNVPPRHFNVQCPPEREQNAWHTHCKPCQSIDGVSAIDLISRRAMMGSWFSDLAFREKVFMVIVPRICGKTRLALSTTLIKEKVMY